MHDISLKSVNFQLVGFSQTSLRQPLTDVLALVSLQLKHLSVLGVLNHRAVASKFLFFETNKAQLVKKKTE